MESGLEIESLRGRLGRAMAECDALRRQLAEAVACMESSAAIRDAKTDELAAVRVALLRANMPDSVFLSYAEQVAMLVQQRDAARRELADRDEREREAAERIAVLPATPEDAESLRTIFARLHDVMVTTPGTDAGHVAVCALESAIDACEVGIFARAVIVEPIAADGEERLAELYDEAVQLADAPEEGHRVAVRAVAAAAIAHDRQRRAEQPATPRVEPDEAMVEQLAEVAFSVWRPGVARSACGGAIRGPWRNIVRAILAELDATESDLARRLAECEAERDAWKSAAEADGEQHATPDDLRAHVLECVEHHRAHHEREEAAQHDPAEAGPLVDVVGRIMRDTLDHEPDLRRAAERVATHVERSLPSVRDVADGYLPLTWPQSDRDARAANILALVRDRLGLADPAPEREEPPSEPEPAGTWATLPEDVCMAVRRCELRWVDAVETLADVERHDSAREDLAAVLHRWKSERPEPEAVSVEAVREIIVEHVQSVEDDDGVNGKRVWGGNAAARAIVARYGSPPAVPVLALPSVEEVAASLAVVVGHGALPEYWSNEAHAVLDLIRERQPAALREALERLRALPDGALSPPIRVLRHAGTEACVAAADLLAALDGVAVGHESGRVMHCRNGNCWDDGTVRHCDECGADNVCDVCHEHRELRGECEECPPCEACDEEPQP